MNSREPDDLETLEEVRPRHRQGIPTQLAISVGVGGTPYWAHLLDLVSTGMSFFAGVCGVIIGAHAAGRIVYQVANAIRRMWRRRVRP